ncbi:hypothetical protein, partial [Hyphomonas sp. ND6WE1B]|uniref:hypothetical protein n=1 Tax=Hyphomonas sp. ND6WE1B TaxID=1848191 RepID=UPI001F31E965
IGRPDNQGIALAIKRRIPPSLSGRRHPQFFAQHLVSIYFLIFPALTQPFLDSIFYLPLFFDGVQMERKRR